MNDDHLPNAVRLVVSACSSQSAAESCYWVRAGKQDMVACHCRCDIAAVLPQLKPPGLAAAAVVVAHASAQFYAALAGKQAEWTAARAESRNRTRT